MPGESEIGESSYGYGENNRYVAGYSMILTIQEVGKILRARKYTTYDLISSGEIPSIKIGRQIRIYSKNLLQEIAIEKAISEITMI